MDDNLTQHPYPSTPPSLWAPTLPSPWPLPPLLSILPLLLLFLPLLTTPLRHRRLHFLQSQYPTRASLSTMTRSSASLIQLSIAELDFPFTYEKALQFALFRTYGVPSISALLAATGQLTCPVASFKRYADTACMVAEMMVREFGGEEWVGVVARVNWVHGRYMPGGRTTGKGKGIRKEDMLYTLSLFAGEPVRWIEEVEWRALSDVEMCAMGVFWKGVGDAMGIEYRGLRGWESGEGWRDGLEWLEEVREWGRNYEEREMRAHEANRLVALKTEGILLFGVPTWAKGFASRVVSVLMGDRLREAMMYERPPRRYFTLVYILITLRKLFLRYLAFPRPSFLRVRAVSDKPSENGMFFLTKYDAMPYYVRPTIWNRWGPSAWLSRVMGLPLPGDQGDRFYPRGYKAEDLGPEAMRGKGVDAVTKEKDNLRERLKEREKKGTGCPVGLPLR